jgi:hypothetical protein
MLRNLVFMAICVSLGYMAGYYFGYDSCSKERLPKIKTIKVASIKDLCVYPKLSPQDARAACAIEKAKRTYNK